jgi:uncharacterized membrane protein YedE/YeeE
MLSALCAVMLLVVPCGISYAAPAAGDGQGAGYGSAGAYGAAEAVMVAQATGMKKVSAAAKKRWYPPVTVGFIFSGLLIGIAVGWMLQRGRFCMNSAFRDTIFIKDFTYFRAYIIALMVMIIGANILNDMGVVRLPRQPFWWLAQSVGGYLFGLGMVLAGGCGSGILYRVGEGLLASWVAVLGFFMGIAATSHGLLKPVFEFMRSFTITLGGKSAPGLEDLVGGGVTLKWVVIAVLVAAGSVFVLKGKPFAYRKSKGYFWSMTGLVIGILGIVAFWASAKWGGFPRGLSFTTPTRDMFFTLITGSAQAGAPFKMHSMGYLLTTWPAVYIIGVPIGAYISSKVLKEFAWKVPPATELLTVFGGSLLMGFGATVGGGCNVGQALTGFSTLSIGSVVASIFIILGNWTMVYFKFIKPMQDLDLD